MPGMRNHAVAGALQLQAYPGETRAGYLLTITVEFLLLSLASREG